MNSILNCTNGTPPIENNSLCRTDVKVLPCCYCNYCDLPENMNIINNSQNTSVINNNLVIQQQMSVTPKRISNIKAEIVSFKEFEVNEDCKTCRKNNEGVLLENEVYHFMGTNTAQWSTSSLLNALPANGTNSFPTKIIEWQSNDKGNINFNLNIALPGTASLSCCERHGVICVRYSFTDIECKTCTILVCYNY